MRYSPLIFVIATAIGCGSIQSIQNALEGDDKTRIQGKWQVTSLDGLGKSAPADEMKNMEVTIEGDTMTLMYKGEVTQKVKITLDPSASPKQIDVTETLEEPSPPKGKEVKAKAEVKTKMVKGVYELKDDTLTICRPGGAGDENLPRPTSVTPAERKNMVVIVLTRVK